MHKFNRTLITLALAPGLLVACASEPSGDVGEGPATGDAVEVVAGDAFFEPDTLELEAGERVTVEVTNEGEADHDFSIEELGISTGSIEPGAVKTISFEVPRGMTEFVCSYHGGMTGSIVAR